MSLTPARQPSAAGRKRVLMVDDDTDVCRLVAQVLAKNGFEARVTNDPLQASKLASEFNPDLIILDYEMPALQGTELSVLLKSRAETRAIPIIFLSGLVELDHHVAGKFSGAAAYLDKPLDEGKLIETIRSLTRRSEPR